MKCRFCPFFCWQPVYFADLTVYSFRNLPILAKGQFLNDIEYLLPILFQSKSFPSLILLD
ncbi:hypothetical protein [Spirosoma pollinicola]|uniref:Uncharacterized protein n=1 Tax=Spirosoma pollinicola TaxID=2057025 RepID=A0A2K8YSP1_9BACT|nr:hypothetical protein [Spirosoma pollinicola]AUD00643.1 hypothetical protein CWM47_01700 [Spirosoma pollinicola]